jgi:hypothetical protein
MATVATVLLQTGKLDPSLPQRYPRLGPKSHMPLGYPNQLGTEKTLFLLEFSEAYNINIGISSEDTF